jgi:hypothetical protein
MIGANTQVVITVGSLLVGLAAVLVVFLIEVDQIFAALVVQCFEDKSSQFVVAHELTPATP